MHHGILEQLLILLAASLPFAVLLRAVGQSTILGYLLAGLVIGPGGLGLIHEAAIDTLAEIGVALLLFSIGIELTFAQLARAQHVALIGGALQIGLTIAVAMLVAHQARRSMFEGAFIGCAVALSSSAIVLKTLADRAELDAPHAPGVIGISIVQDLATVPMLVLLPALRSGAGGGGETLVVPIATALGKAALVLGGMWVGSRFFLGPILYLVARTRSAEVFVITIVALVLAAAWGAASAGLSLAIGAFCAGILLSESEYSHQIMADILPFKDVFQSIFFVSVGMLLDARWVADHPAPVAIAIGAVVLGKTLITSIAARLAGVPTGVALATGIALAQVGEFSFVLVTLGDRLNLVSRDVYQLALAASVGSMAVAPPLIANVRAIVGRLAAIPLLGRAFETRAEPALKKDAAALSNHVIIGGFGPVGRDVAQVLFDHGIEFVIVELNPRTVRDFKEKGFAIYFGDCANRVVLEEAGIRRARALVLAMPDAKAARRAARLARALNPKIVIVARTKYRLEVETFIREGADEVVEEEFETALEMVVRLMSALEIPRRIVAERMAGQRLERYRMKPTYERLRTEGGPLPAFEIEIVKVRAPSELVGKTLGEADVRARTGATVLALIREERVVMNPPPDVQLRAYDKLACVGTGRQLADLEKLADPGGETGRSGAWRPARR